MKKCFTEMFHESLKKQFNWNLMLWYTVSQCILPLIVSELALLYLKSQLWNQRNIKKLVLYLIIEWFDEGLQGICYNELEDLVKIAKIFICFCKNQICWESKRLTLERLNNNNSGKLRLECFLWIRKEYALANWATI